MADGKYRNALPLGGMIGSFRIERILGQGGFGITYLAHDEKLDRQVAIKEYFPTEFSMRAADGTVNPQSEEEESVYVWGMERFLNEGQTLAKYKHPNIVRVIDYLEENHTAYIIMEYEHGDDLQTILKEKKTLSAGEVLEIFRPLLDGLALVHQSGFIHRDIKPANIFIRVDGSPVLIDFGSARQGLASKTRTLTTLVSPGYAPFEQYNAEGPGKQGPWTDIYALGASMYKALFGRSPLDAVSRAEERVAGRPDPYMSAVTVGGDEYSPQLLQAIDRALAFLPNERPQTIDEWLAFFPGAETRLPILEDSEAQTLKVSAPVEQPAGASEVGSTPDVGLKLAVTRFIVFGMLTLWVFTAYVLCDRLQRCAVGAGVAIDARMRYVFSGIYGVLMLVILSWTIPNVFLGYVFNLNYILWMILLSALLFYLNTAAFVLWYMKGIKRLDGVLLDGLLTRRGTDAAGVREERNAWIGKWEDIDNHVVLFLVISLPIIFSPYVCARILYSGASQYLTLALPVIVMSLGGVFHVWGTRLLINTYNNTLT